MHPFDEFERSGIVPLCDDHCENALSQLVGLPRWVVSLENGPHRQSVFCNREATVEDGLQLRGQRPEIAMPERLGMLQSVPGANCLEDLHPSSVVYRFESITRRHEVF
mmetsp:Transcript_16767/g.35431  ORF Transcript_16767/g.35431 Transcript_16767/m.35431 type:complete len:108 (-) Transcript_16767:6584-6907(-)